MQDAESSSPVCGDIYAKKFMSQDGLEIYEAFKGEVKPNASNVARHRIIDDHLRHELSVTPDRRIILIGAGFDSRAYRLSGGRWIEIDEPQIISYKNDRLPTDDSPNELRRIPIDFTTESIKDKLSATSGKFSPIIVIEGVFLYLDDQTINNLLQSLKLLYPSHKIICDLMTRKFFEKYSRTLHERITEIGTSFILKDNPTDSFIKNGYRPVEKTSTVIKAIEWGLIKAPKLFVHLFLRTLSQGYSVYVFESD